MVSEGPFEGKERKRREIMEGGLGWGNSFPSISLEKKIDK